MSFSLNPDETPGAGLARLVREQAGRLKEACANGGADPAAFVHKSRVRCKKIRAALRLARPLIGEKAYRQENAYWRDAARGLSQIRDLSARIEALEAQRPVLETEIGIAATDALAARFVRDRDRFVAAGKASVPLEIFRHRIAAHDPDMRGWIEPGDFDRVAEALGCGYVAARKAMTTALRNGTPELFHEWRKQAKYHALQVRLARQVFPALDARVAAARKLGEHLGAVQDIEVVIQGLSLRATRMRRTLERRRETMMVEAYRAGAELFVERRKTWLGMIRPVLERAEELA